MNMTARKQTRHPEVSIYVTQLGEHSCKYKELEAYHVRLDFGLLITDVETSMFFFFALLTTWHFHFGSLKADNCDYQDLLKRTYIYNSFVIYKYLYIFTTHFSSSFWFSGK